MKKSFKHGKRFYRSQKRMIEDVRGSLEYKERGIIDAIGKTNHGKKSKKDD